MELEKLSGLEIGKLVNNKEVSPVETVTYFLDRVYARNSRISAFTYTAGELALKAAANQEKQILDGEDVGPLAGVPIAFKDFLDSKKGWSHSFGGVLPLVQVDAYDSEFCKAAEGLGAIAIGKTNAPAFGFSGLTDNMLVGPTRNPFNTLYNSGGSSGGSAAAVADGLVPIAEGGDAGGSIRIPASWCNCFGFKASVGSVVNYCRPDAWSATHPFCVNGAITKTVDDCAVIMNKMIKYDRRDPYSVPHNDTDLTLNKLSNVLGLKVAMTHDFNLFPTEDEMVDAVERVGKILSSSGAEVKQVSFEFKHKLYEFESAWMTMISLDTALELKQWKIEGLDLLDDENRRWLQPEFIFWNERASHVTLDDMLRFNKIRTDILDAHEAVFDNYDIILAPVTACGPVPNSKTRFITSGPSVIGGKRVNPTIGFSETYLENFIGYPAASIPAGLTKDGLPVGVQIIAPKYRDDLIFKVAYFLEKANPWIQNFYKIN